MVQGGFAWIVTREITGNSKMATNRTDVIISELREPPAVDACKGVAGERGIHEDAANEIIRLRRTLEAAIGTFHQIARLNIPHASKLAKAAAESGQKALDFQ